MTSLRLPKALLLDFSGVIVDAPAVPQTPGALITRLRDLTGDTVPTEKMERDLIEGTNSYSRWRNAASEQGHPSELRHTEVFDRFITGTWPEAAREQVRSQAADLCYSWTYQPDWEVLPGISELLDVADARNIPTAIVSNTLCGAAHRGFLRDAGLGDRFAAQLYSNEIGIRKPNPAFALMAARELGHSIHDCWLIGDSLSRDIACARRADCGAAILVHSPRANRETGPGIEPDVRLDGSTALPSLLTDAGR